MSFPLTRTDVSTIILSSYCSRRDFGSGLISDQRIKMGFDPKLVLIRSFFCVDRDWGHGWADPNLIRSKVLQEARGPKFNWSEINPITVLSGDIPRSFQYLIFIFTWSELDWGLNWVELNLPAFEFRIEVFRIDLNCDWTALAVFIIIFPT